MRLSCSRLHFAKSMRLLAVVPYTVVLLSSLLFYRPKGPPASVWLWPLRLLAQALAPVLGLIGIVAALVGLRRRNGALVTAGFLGAALNAHYIQRVSSHHDAFARAFGPDWEQRIPLELRPRLWPRRWTPLTPPPPAIRLPDIRYGVSTDGTPLLADLWLPPTHITHSGLGIIYIHGGAWRRGDKDAGTRPFFRRLAGQGHVILDIAYSLGPKVPLTQMVGDVKRAILWLKAHAADYDIRPDRIVLIGGSAGGHLALLAAYTPNHPELPPGPEAGDTSVRAVAAFYPPTDLLAIYRESQALIEDLLGAQNEATRLRAWAALATFRALGFVPRARAGSEEMNYIARLLGGRPETVPHLYRLLSPVAHLGPHCPPTLLLQGSDDFFGFAPTVRRFYEALLAAGVVAVLIEYPHADHAFDLVLPRLSPVAQAAVYDVERFLALMV